MTKAKEEEVKIPDAEVVGKPPEGYTEEEWMGLSDTERGGIIDSIENPEVSEGEIEEEEIDDATLAEIAGEEAPKEEKKVEGFPEKPKEEKVEEKPEGEVAKPVEEPIVEKPAEEEPIETGERLSDADLKTFRPVVAPNELPTIDTVPPELKAKLSNLRQKHNEGEISPEDYEEQRDAVNRQIWAYQSEEREKVRFDKVWEKEQGFFLSNRPEYLGELGPDGRYKNTVKSISLFGALSEQIKVLSADKRFASVSGMELLIAADKAVKDAFGITQSPKPKVVPKAEVKQKEGGKPSVKIPDVKTLSNVPNAASNTTEDAFSQIDKLHGEAYEAALERMTPEQRNRYENDLRPRAR